MRRFYFECSQCDALFSVGGLRGFLGGRCDNCGYPLLPIPRSLVASVERLVAASEVRVSQLFQGRARWARLRLWCRLRCHGWCRYREERHCGCWCHVYKPGANLWNPL